jgi:hypothetical protein
MGCLVSTDVAQNAGRVKQRTPRQLCSVNVTAVLGTNPFLLQGQFRPQIISPSLLLMRRTQAMANPSIGSVAPGTLVSWEEGIGDDKKYHIVYVSPAGITLVRKMKDYTKWQEVVAAANNSPNEAAAMLQQLPKAVHLARSEISKTTCAEQLNQLTLFGQNQQKTKVPEGKEQAEVFAAIKQHLGATESEEEADAWSVMQTPLFVLAVIGVIGGFFIWFTTICEPDYEATGRRDWALARDAWEPAPPTSRRRVVAARWSSATSTAPRDAKARRADQARSSDRPHAGCEACTPR